jgi:hypothetical protein
MNCKLYGPAFLVLVLLSASATYGVQKKSPPQPTSKEPEAVAVQWQSALLIKLKGSREQPTAGSDFGISADIENISDKYVYLNPQGLTMTAPPEVDANGPEDWPAFLPGPAVAVENGKPPTPWDRVVVLAPHSRISAFWSGNLRKLQRDQTRSRLDKVCEIFGEDCSTMVNNIAFPPGKYTITVVGSYWDSAEGAKNKETTHRTETASTDLEIVAAQATVLFGAAIGGLLAFLLIPSLRPALGTEPAIYKALKLLGGLITSMLLSVVVTILLARLSQSQFLIKITVNDFWGAMTVGFIVSASGSAILRQITTLGRGTTPVPATPPAQPAQPVAPKREVVVAPPEVANEQLMHTDEKPT